MTIGLKSVDGTENGNFGSALQCFALYSHLVKLFPNDKIARLSYKNPNGKNLVYDEGNLYGRPIATTLELSDVDMCVVGSDCMMYFNESDQRDDWMNEFFMTNSGV